MSVVHKILSDAGVTKVNLLGTNASIVHQVELPIDIPPTFIPATEVDIFNELSPVFTGRERKCQTFHYEGRHLMLFWHTRPEKEPPISKDFFFGLRCPSCDMIIKFYSEGQNICNCCDRRFAIRGTGTSIAILVEEANFL